eukprot:540166_1
MLFWCLFITMALFMMYSVYWIWKHNPILQTKELKNKNIIITGASRGIGEQIAYECAKAGANLLITATNKSSLETVKQKCIQLGCKSVKTIPIDLANINNCKALAKECLSEFSETIDYLCLNHVIGHYSEWINNCNTNTFDINSNLNKMNTILSVNVSAYIAIATLLYPILEKCNGRIICVSSFAGYSIGPYASVYAASKHGISSFFDNWRVELLMNKSNVSITICILSLVATKSALSAVKNILPDTILKGAANPNDIAKQIISGGQARLKYVYAPFTDIFIACSMQRIVPSIMTMFACYINYKRFW